MPRRQYNRALATYELGTKIYAPTAGEPRFRILTKDPTGKRITRRVDTEAEARIEARSFETMLASSVALPGRLGAPATVGQLADRYLASLGSRSTRYAERQEYLLRMCLTSAELKHTAVPEWGLDLGFRARWGWWGRVTTRRPRRGATGWWG